MDQRKLDHVIDQLNQYSGPKKKINSWSTFVSCPYHTESTPSFRIFHSPDSRGSPGYAKCYGCGATAKWDEVAPKLGLKPYQWTKPGAEFARPLRQEEAEQESQELVFSSLPGGKVWRGIKTDLLLKIKCRKVKVRYEGNRLGPTFLYFPALIRGELRGYIRARLRKEKDRPSYLNAPGGWSKDYGLFPYDYAVKVMKRKGLSTIVLVEGPRDALRLLSLGIPAIAILGTQSWSDRKSRQVELTGAKHVILCMDGDDAGLKAVELIKPQLDKMIDTSVFDLTAEDSPYWPFRNKAEPTKAAKKRGISLWDPGEMPMSKVKELRACLN